MNRNPMDSFNKPFQSGDGLCYPIYAQNYYKTQTTPMYGGHKTKKSQKSQKGGDNFIKNLSQPSTINDYPGDAYLTNPNERYDLTGSGVPQPMNPLTQKFLSNNMGVTYATQAGGRKKKYKGGMDYESPGAFNDSASTLGSTQGQNSGSLNRANKQRGGKTAQNSNMPPPQEAPLEESDIQTSILSASKPVQGMYPVLSGGKYRKYNKKGGNMPGPAAMTGPAAMPGMNGPAAMPGMNGPAAMPGMTGPAAMPGMNGPAAMPGMTGPAAMPGMTGPAAMPGMTGPVGMPTPAGMPSMTGPAAMPFMPQPGMSQPSVPQANMDIMSGGRYKKYSKKGGNYIFTHDADFSGINPGDATQMNRLAQAQHIPRGGFAMKDMSGVDAQMAASGSYIPSEMNEMMGGRKKSSRKLKGGVSDFATTLASRGPINYPDALSAQRFRYFNKTGTFIPNTMLQYAAAPISTGYQPDPNPYPLAYNDYIGGAKKKKAPKKKTTAASKKKAAPAKKKAAPAKKKAAPAKKKSASTKKKSASTKKK
jgi:hypothetical protein